ncbi:MAG: LicD family protein [Lachnospiraceae bacterium]|nr:LicD family protein [Lachnospiraceae bacterium]
MGMEYKQYDPEVLKKLQKTQLGILKDFIQICEKYNLTYIMLGGTGIGVVRHQGFIPWDDDIDVAMPREDYDVFLAMVEKEMGDKYRIQTPLTDPDYACNVTHMQKRGTKFVPYVNRMLKCELCISIDIFPMDHMPSDPKRRKTQLKKTWILNKLIFLCGTGKPIIPLKGIKKQAAAVVCEMIHLFLKVCHVKPAFLYRKLVKEATRYNDQPTKYINAFEVTMSDRAYLSMDELYPLKKMRYEDLEVTMPNQYDVYLTRLFGDYMTMPSEDKRVNHCPYILDFGEED